MAPPHGDRIPIFGLQPIVTAIAVRPGRASKLLNASAGTRRRVPGPSSTRPRAKEARRQGWSAAVVRPSVCKLISQDWRNHFARTAK